MLEKVRILQFWSEWMRRGTALQRTMGLFYDVRVHLAENDDDYVGKKRTTVSMGVRKAQYASLEIKDRSPVTTSKAEKGFMFGSGKIKLEINIDRDVWYHGEEIPVHYSITNQSNMAVKNIRSNIIQNCELVMVNAQYYCKVASLDTQDGCPLLPGSNLNRTITLKPLAQNCYGIRGLCLDAALSKVTDESNLASSSLADTGNHHDLLGVVVTYRVRIKLVMACMGGVLEADLPFKLVHPRPSIIYYILPYKL